MAVNDLGKLLSRVALRNFESIASWIGPPY